MNTEKPHQQTNKNSTPRSKNCLAKILTRRDVTWHVPLPLFKSGLPSTISPWLTSVGPVWGVLSVSKNWTNRGRCAHHALRKNNLFPREEHSRRTNLSGLLRNYNNRGSENSFFLILQVNWHHYMEELLKKNENTYAKKGNFLDTPFFSLLTIEIWKQLSTPISSSVIQMSINFCIIYFGLYMWGIPLNRTTYFDNTSTHNACKEGTVREREYTCRPATIR